MNAATKGLVSTEADRRASLEDSAILLTSMSNVVRLGVLVRITKREWSVNELAADLKISQSALSQHLRRMRQAGVVHYRKDRQTVLYHCSNDTVIALLDQLRLSR